MTVDKRAQMEYNKSMENNTTQTKLQQFKENEIMTTLFTEKQGYSFGDGYKAHDHVTKIVKDGDFALGVTAEGYLVSFSESQGWVMCADEVTEESISVEIRDHESLKEMAD